MKEIEEKLLELKEILKVIPVECKGNTEEARANRAKYLKVRRLVYDIVP